MSVKFWSCGVLAKNKRKSSDVGSQTMTQVWRLQCWSFNALYKGEHPCANWLGKEFDAKAADGIIAGAP